MGLAVESLLQLIQDAHPALHVVRTDAGIGLRALQVETQKLVGLLLRERPEALTLTEATVALSSTQFSGSGWDFASGVAPLSVASFEIRETASQKWRPVTRTAWDGRYVSQPIPYVTVRGAVMYPIGEYEAYVGFDTWKALYCPQVPALAMRGSGATISMLPDHASNALASAAAWRLAVRLGDNAVPKPALAALKVVRDDDFEAFMQLVNVDASHERFVRRDVVD